MQKFLLLLLSLPLFYASAQKIEGTVYDDEGKVLAFSSILVKGTQQGVTANNHGNFSITLTKGIHTLICRHVGYATQEKTVTIDSISIVVNFSLALQKLVLKEIVIRQGEDFTISRLKPMRLRFI